MPAPTDIETDRGGVSRPPVGVICGNGRLPLAVLDSLAGQGRRCVAVAIRGEAEAELCKRADLELGFGEIGRLFKKLKARGCQDLVLIGGVAKRPDFTSILGDPGTLRRLPKIIKALQNGDDTLLTKVIGLFEVEGFRVAGLQEVAPELLAGAGALGRHQPDEAARADMALALKSARRLGDLDVGQGAVAVTGRVIALEGAEGTDAMLERCAELRRIGRVRGKVPAGVLVKAVKPQQDLRVDLPTVGPQTVAAAKAAGLSGIAVQAGAALIAEKDQTVKAADEAGLFLYGFGADDGFAAGGDRDPGHD